MISGVKYRVQDRLIVKMRIDGDLLKYYQSIKKSEIEIKFGKSDLKKRRMSLTMEHYSEQILSTNRE